MRRFFIALFHKAAILAGIACGLILTLVIYFSLQIPSKFYVAEGHEFKLDNHAAFSNFSTDKLFPLSTASLLDYSKESMVGRGVGSSKTVSINLMGIIPVTTTHVSVISEQEVTPGGSAFGIKLFTKGVMVVDITGIETSSGIVSPAKLAGLEKGDIILNVNNMTVHSNEELAALIEESNGKVLSLSVARDGVEFKAKLSPALSNVDGKYKGGVWVRDSSAGIGTVTYYNKATGVFAGLGHGITDSDTGKIMPLSTGEVCRVQINGVKKGQVGTPGELRGSFTSSTASGKLLLNNECGIFGVLGYSPNDMESVPIRLKQDVKPGPAVILCTLSKGGVEEFAINIDKIDLNPKTQTKNMVISVTDPDLLARTGGIVQGMSGSPILQEGELVGAVTHVLVNNPQRGYGIFAENMINYSSTITDDLSAAS